MHRSAGVGRRLAALAVAVSMSGVPVCFGQSFRSAGTLTGRIFLADGVTPRSGVVVKAANLSTSQIFQSIETDRSGHYAFADLPSGQYQVAVAAGEGLYVNGERVPVIQGRKTLFSMALNPTRAQDNPPGQEPPPTPPPQDQPPQAQPPAQEPPPQEGAKPEEKKPEEKKPEDKGKTPAEQEAAKGKKKSGQGFWRSGWGVAIGLGGGAIVLGLLADSIAGNNNNEVTPPSPTTP